jgi:hypothetical protein
LLRLQADIALLLSKTVPDEKEVEAEGTDESDFEDDFGEDATYSPVGTQPQSPRGSVQLENPIGAVVDIDALHTHLMAVHSALYAMRHRVARWQSSNSLKAWAT